MNIPAINSLTKYPSIPTYHKIGDKGRLLNEPAEIDGDILLFATEKIDGTNARIIITHEDYLIGSREEILTAMNDRVYNPAQGIAQALIHTADRIALLLTGVAIFGEVYGGKTSSNARQYTTAERVGFRVFDIMTIADPPASNLLQSGDCKAIAAWRDAGGQMFVDSSLRDNWCDHCKLATVPPVWMGRAKDIPTSIADTRDWMESLLQDGSQCRLDADAPGRPEGLVIRSADRSVIYKLRFEDYHRSLRR